MAMKQQCYMGAIWLSWAAVPVLVVVVGLLRGWVAAAVVLAAAVLAQLAYLRWFPRISGLMGYGSVADVPAGEVARGTAHPTVTLYTANVCPFCPLVKQRLAALQPDIGFELEEVDVTFRPGLIRARGLRTVPVIEADGRFLLGNATSEQLAAFLTGREKTVA